MFTIVIPTGVDLQALKQTLASLGKGHDLLLVARAVDWPELVLLAGRYKARLIEEPGSRGAQKNAGIAAARSPWVLILHPGGVLEAGWADALRRFIQTPGNEMRAAMFRFALEDTSADARYYEKLMAWCARSGGGSGAQGLIIHRCLWEHLGGFKPEPLYEDMAMLRAIHRQGDDRLTLLFAAIRLPAARYQEKGSYWKGLFRRLTSLYFYGIGVSPRKIAQNWPPENRD